MIATSGEFLMIAKTFKGLEPVLAEELIGLGANEIQIERRAVSFKGDKALMYKANLHLRTASRVLVPIEKFRAKTTDEIYDKIKSIEWSNFMSSNSTFSISSTVFSENFSNSRFITYRMKDAIVDYFMEKENKRPNVSVSNPQFYFNIHIANDEVTISLDSSGESLHKRGYRAEETEAPLNEALAAGMILLSNWRGQSDFVDPMCGSGTLLIEAALIALNIPPGIFKNSFAFEKWSDYDDDLFQMLYNDDSNERKFEYKIYGSDISPKAVAKALQNVKSAGLSKYIEIETVAVQNLEPKTDKCIMICNPPYGERIMSNDIFALYGDLGTFIKHKMTGNRAWVISSNDDALKRIALRPSQKVELLNGALDCLYCEYEIFEGKRKEFVAGRDNAHRGDFHRDKPRQGSFDRDKSRQDRFSRNSSGSRSFDRDKPRQGNFDRDKSRQDRFSRDNSGSRSFDRDKPRQGNFDRDKSRQDRFSRDSSAPRSYDRDKPRQERLGKDKSRQDRFSRDSSGSRNFDRDKPRQERLGKDKSRQDRFSRDNSGSRSFDRDKPRQERFDRDKSRQDRSGRDRGKRPFK